MRNPILVFLISMEHLLPISPYVFFNKIMSPIKQIRFGIYPMRFEHYCVVCGRRYTYDWWEEEE